MVLDYCIYYESYLVSSYLQYIYAYKNPSLTTYAHILNYLMPWMENKQNHVCVTKNIINTHTGPIEMFHKIFEYELHLNWN